MSLPRSACSSCSHPPSGGTTEETLRPDHEHYDQQSEGDRVLELAAILECGIHGRNTHQCATEKRAEITAESTHNRRNETVQHVGDAGIIGNSDYWGCHEPCRTDDQAADREG